MRNGAAGRESAAPDASYRPTIGFVPQKSQGWLAWLSSVAGLKLVTFAKSIMTVDDSNIIAVALSECGIGGCGLAYLAYCERSDLAGDVAGGCAPGCPESNKIFLERTLPLATSGTSTPQCPKSRI
jgi:hypothetical protein